MQASNVPDPVRVASSPGLILRPRRGTPTMTGSIESHQTLLVYSSLLNADSDLHHVMAPNKSGKWAIEWGIMARWPLPRW